MLPCVAWMPATQSAMRRIRERAAGRAGTASGLSTCYSGWAMKYGSEMRCRSGPALCAGSPAVALVGETGPQRQVFVAGVKANQIDELIGRSRIQRQAGFRIEASWAATG